MKIGIDIRPLQTDQKFRGIGRYCYNMVKALQEIDGENSYLLLYGKGLYLPQGIIEDLHRGNFAVSPFLIPTNRVTELFYFKDRLRIPLEVLRRNLDIFYSFDWPFPLVQLPGRRQFLVTMYGVSPYPLDMAAIRDFTDKLSNVEKPTLKRRIKEGILSANHHQYLKLLKEKIGKVSHFIVSSENSKADLAKTFQVPLEKISVVNEGINREVFKLIHDESKKEAVKKKFNIRDPFILFVSAIDWKKNIINMLKAFKQATEGFTTPHQLVLAGSYLKSDNKPTQQFMLYKELVRELGLEDRVIFTGYISDEELVLLYNAATSYILPSFYEGFPLTALEAMACGTAVIASSTSSMPEILNNASLYFDPQNIQSIASSMIQICNDSAARTRLVENGYAVANQYSWLNSARKVLAVLRQMKSNGATA